MAASFRPLDLQRHSGLRVKQGQQVPSFDEMVQFGLLLAGQKSGLISFRQVGHLFLILVIETESQDVSSQFAGQARTIGPDEASENDQFARCVALYSLSVSHEDISLR